MITKVFCLGQKVTLLTQLSKQDGCSMAYYYGEDTCLQTMFCYFNVQIVKQENSLFHQPIVLWLAVLITIGDFTDIFAIYSMFYDT